MVRSIAASFVSMSLASVLLAILALPAMAADNGIPTAAPHDAVMAAPSEIAAMTQWAERVFTRAQPAAKPQALGLELRRQDYNELRRNASIMKSPLAIGRQKFQHGLGTHANSEIVVTLPEKAKRFRASVGVDVNPTTQGKLGSVQFSIEIGGKEIVRTPTLCGGQDAAAIDIEIPADARSIVLKTDTTADGPSHDHADWADAAIVLEDGSVCWIDEAGALPLLGGDRPPLSFVYGGKPSAELLAAWPQTVQSCEAADRVVHNVAWTDTDTGLRVEAEVSVFKEYPAVDWVLYFENTGKQDTPLLENILPLDASLTVSSGGQGAVLHSIRGDNCSDGSFTPFSAAIETGKPLRFSPVGGRPSNGAFPFFQITSAGQGLTTAIGWSGQWMASVERTADKARLVAGMEQTRLLLHPGERIRTPRILLMSSPGDRTAAQNRLRRLLLFHYVPKVDGKPAALPIFWQTYDRYNGRKDWCSEAGQIAAVEVAKTAGAEWYWLDAAWFPGHFPNGVGNWFCKPEELPHGLKPVSDACHKAGMKFMLWFEPERVAKGTQIATEHPEFVFGGSEGGLFKLSDPAARRWLTDLLVQRIEEYGIDWYRNDFNIDPLDYWRRADAPDRQGMTEIRYVEGHYAMWDEMRQRRGGMLIDNCASGGRRIDLETISRSIPLWRSDTACSPDHADWDQMQVCALSQWIPLSTSCAWTSDAYTFRSAACAGAIAQLAFLDPGFDMARAQAAFAEAKANRKYWYGDLYPLTDCTTDARAIMAWQLHRADLDEGLVLAFRRKNCDYLGLNVRLSGVSPEKSYQVEFIDEARQVTTRTATGRELREDFALLLPKRGTSLLVRYRQE